MALAFLTNLPFAAAALEPLRKVNDASTQAVDHAQWAAILAKYVAAGEDGVNRFDYAAVSKADRAALDGYLAALQNIAPTSLNKAEATAYYFNLYNALTVQVVLDAWPVKSIRQIKPGFLAFGPWRKARVRVEGHDLSLDDIEHGILRPMTGDARVHYAVNCASWSCPNLAHTPFTGAALEQQLEDAARAYINHPRGVWFNAYGRLYVSSIYKWYGEDFGGNDKGIIAHLKKYAEGELAEKLAGMRRISGDDYDWTINAPGKNKGDY